MIAFRWPHSKMDLMVSDEFIRNRGYNPALLPTLYRRVYVEPTFVSITTWHRDFDRTIYWWTEKRHTVKIEYDFTGECGCEMCLHRRMR